MIFKSKHEPKQVLKSHEYEQQVLFMTYFCFPTQVTGSFSEFTVFFFLYMYISFCDYCWVQKKAQIIFFLYFFFFIPNKNIQINCLVNSLHAGVCPQLI